MSSVPARVLIAIAGAAGCLAVSLAIAAPASAAGNCVGQLASSSGAEMTQVVHGWQDGQPNPPGFSTPGAYAANLARAAQCPA